MNQKRVYILHGWDGHPEEDWFQWLKGELEAREFEVHIPQLPEAEKPRIHNWVSEVSNAVGTVNENTYFVGHSLGCQTIVRYLEGLPEDGDIKIGGAVFVAGFFKRLSESDNDTDDDLETKRHWLDSPPDFRKASSHLPKSVAIFSDNDPDVPLDNQDDFREKLGSEIVIMKNMGHFTSGDDGMKEAPFVLRSLLGIIQ